MFLLCVACALVCAAFLDGACATTDFGPWVQNASYFGFCRTKHKGYRTRKILNLQEILIPPYETHYTLHIPDLCQFRGWNQAGVVVTVCDRNAKPTVILRSVAQVSVRHKHRRLNKHRRLHQPTAAATCYIKQYCNLNRIL